MQITEMMGSRSLASNEFIRIIHSVRFVFTCSSNTSDFVLKDGKGAYPTFFFMFLFLKITSEVSLNYVKKKSLKGFPWNSHKKKSYDICTQREENV